MGDDNNQSYSEFEELLRSKKKFKADESSEQLSLHEIVAKNDVQQLNYLLDLYKSQGEHIDINEKDLNGRTPLHNAAISNEGQSHFELIEILLNNGADINARDFNKHAPVWFLVQNCNLNILKLFLRFDADLTNVDNQKSSILLSAVKSGDNLDVIKFLVQDLGLDVNHRNMFGATPLHWASMYNSSDSHYEVLEYLLENGADVNARNGGGFTSIYCLAAKGNWRVIELFLKHNADVPKVSGNNMNFLFAFDHKNSDVQVFEKMIFDFNLDVNHTDGNKKTPLHHFISFNNIDDPTNIKVIKCLLKNGANLNTYDKDGNSPLISAVRTFRQIEDDWFLKNMDFFNFLIELTDFSIVHVFDYTIDEDADEDAYEENLSLSNYLWKWILEHLAKLELLSIPLHPIIQEFIQNHTDYKDYLTKCTAELVIMSRTKPQKSWINFFNLLVDNRRKLKNYAGNEDLIQDFENNDWLSKFPVYGASIEKKLRKGMKRREFFDKSSILLSDYLPIFNSTHVIVRDIFDCILSKKDLSKFCE